MAKRKSLWRLWAKALGEKDGRTDREADTIASIRTFILICYMVTNVAIVANAIRHWNDVNSNCSQGHTTQTEVSNVSGTALYRGSRTNVVTSGWYGKNCGTEIRTVKKQRMQGKNGVTVLQNTVK